MNSFDEAAGAIGDNHVSRSHRHGALPDHHGATGYGDPFSQEYHRPRGAVRPQTVEEVQAIVTLANKHKVSLWTVSRGRNLG
jgi:4-cresol dehydrogenase (hydroxylating)